MGYSLEMTPHNTFISVEVEQLKRERKKIIIIKKSFVARPNKGRELPTGLGLGRKKAELGSNSTNICGGDGGGMDEATGGSRSQNLLGVGADATPLEAAQPRCVSLRGQEEKFRLIQGCFAIPAQNSSR